MPERYMKRFGRVDQFFAHFRIIKDIFHLSKGNLEVLEMVIPRSRGKFELTNKCRWGFPTFRPTKKNSPTTYAGPSQQAAPPLLHDSSAVRPAATRHAPPTIMTLTAPRTLAVEDILAFSDAELARYMAGKRRPDGDGGFELDDIDGWETRPESERDRLADRLRSG
jgi:hypothetical protein